MNFLKIFIPVLICFVVSFRSVSQDVTTTLKEINEKLELANRTIERSNRTIDSILRESDHKIDSMTQDMKFIGFDPHIGDSLAKLVNYTSRLLIRLKNELNNTDSSGENLDVAEKLLLKTLKGDSLFKFMMHVYDAGIKYGDSISRQRYIPLRKYDKENWLNLYFRKVPTVAAITILSKFRNDLVNVKFTLNTADIKMLKNKILSEAN